MVIRILTFVAATGSAVTGGVLFAFSSFVMPGLNRLDPAEAIRAMNAINVAAVRPAFMTLLFGTAAVTVATTVAGIRRHDTRAGQLLIIGSAVFLVGVIGLTMAYHVPLNDGLARFDPATGDAGRTWADYYRGWTALNHVRALAGGAGAVLLGMAALGLHERIASHL
jgi:uncharacterized membrane protein